jgi:hypothetical protein
MDVTAEDFRRHYALLSDEALLDIDPGELVELARNCHAEEVARRGLNQDDSELAEDPDSVPSSGSAEEAELVCIVEYDYVDEAEMARGLLEGEKIPVTIESEPGVARLMVPQQFAEQSLRLLVTPLSDEDLEAQAEAAGFEEDLEDEKSGSED